MRKTTTYSQEGSAVTKNPEQKHWVRFDMNKCKMAYQTDLLNGKKSIIESSKREKGQDIARKQKSNDIKIEKEQRAAKGKEAKKVVTRADTNNTG